MADNNRLELEITAINSSGSVIAQFKSELASVSAEAMKAAAAAARASDQIFLSTSNVIERASAAAYRSLERLEARAALAGKTGSDKLTTQFEQGKVKFGGDEAAINRYRTALERLAEVEGQREKAAQARQEAVRTRANNDAIYKLQSDRVREVESPTQRVQRERGEFFDRSGLTLSQRAAAYQEFAVRGAAARQQETEAAGKAAGKAVLSGQAEFEAGLRKLQENDAALAGIRANRVRATETPTQRVQRERTDFLQRGLSPSQRVEAGEEFALREAAARAEETRKAGIAAGKAVLPGAAPFEEAFKKVRARDAEVLEIEDRARKASLSKPDYYRHEMESLLSRAGTTEAAAKRIRAGYADIIKAAEEEEKHGGGMHQVIRRGILAVKDAIEGSSRGAAIEVADIFVGTSGSGGILQGAVPKIAELAGVSNVAVYALGGLAAGLVGVGLAGLHAISSLGEVGEHIKNVSLRTGIAPEHVQAFEFAASSSGVDPNIWEKVTRGIAQAADDNSAVGKQGRRELKDLGVDLFNEFDELKPAEQIIIELAEALDKLPPGLQRSAASMEVLKRMGIESIPVFAEIGKKLRASDDIGNTISKADSELFEQFDEVMKKLSEEWKRFKIETEKPIAIAVYGVFKGFKEVRDEAENSDFFSALRGLFPTNYKAGERSPEMGPERPNFRVDEAGVKHYIGPPTGETTEKLQAKDAADSERKRYATLRGDDPATRLAEARKKLAALDTKAEHGSVKDVTAAEDQFKLVQRLEQSGKGNTAANKGLEDVIAARTQGHELDYQFAEIQLANKTNEMSARLETRKGFSTPEDIDERLRLATLVVDAKQTLEIEKRRKIVDTKTGREVDMSNDPGFKRFQATEEELRPKLIRNEFEKILGKANVDDEQRLKAERDDWGKSWKEAFDRKQKVQMDLQEEAIRGEYANRSRELDIAATTNDRERDLALQQVGQVNAQTLQEKIALEDQKLAIEQMYAERSLAIQIAKLERERTKAIDDITGRANRENIPLTDAGVVAAIATENQKSDQEIAAAKQATAGKEMVDFQKTQNDKTKLQIESAKTVYQNLKQQAGDLFDQMVFHTKTWGEFAKGIFKTAILTPIKDIFSSQVSAFFTQALTGQKVSFGEVGNGEGAIGRLGRIYGRLGGGQPRFGEQTKPVSNLDQPGHLGDVLHVDGAVPVVIQNAAQVAQAHATAASSGMGPVGSALATSFGSMILAGGRGIPKISPEQIAAGIAESKFIPESLPDSYGMPDGLGSGPSMLTKMFSDSLSATGQSSPNGFPVMGEVAASLLDPDSLRGMFGAARSPRLKPDTHGIRVLGPMPNQDEGKETLESLFPRAQKGFSNNWDASWALSALKRYAVDIPSDEFAQAKADYQSGKSMQALGHGFAAINPFTGIVGDMVEDSKKSAARASKDFQGGNYLGGVNHSLSTALPLLGSMLDSTTDHLSSKNVGDNAEGLGESLGLLLPLVAPSASLGGTAFGLLMKSLEPYKNGELKQDAPPSTGTVSPHGFPTMGEVSALGTPSGIFSGSDNPFAVPTAPPYVDQGLSGVQLADWANANLGPEAAMGGIAGPEQAKGGPLGAIGNLIFGHPQFQPYNTMGGTPPFLPGGTSGQTTSRGGILGKNAGFLGGFKSMFGLDTSGTDMGGGVAIARTGLKGNLAAISKSSGFALIGGMAALDGIRRGGALGTLEAAGGGAAVGFKFGGILGAGIGAAIGGGLALAKTFGLFGDARKHIKKLVKEIYGMDINNAMADQIVAIAKQSFGGQHDVAVRSPQVRELLRLYAQTTGQKSAEDKFVADTVHGASLVEAGGKLQQQAIYDNGSGYAYASPFDTYQGVQTSPIPTYGPTSGGPTHVQLVLNGQAAADVLAGQVSRVATPSFVQGQSQAALGSSIGRNSQTAMTLAPASISR